MAMSLSTEDFQKIRSIFEEVVAPLNNELSALRNDIKEIYDMLAELQSATITDRTFKKRSLEEKLLTLNTELISAAKQAGITLPRP